MSTPDRRALVDRDHARLSVRRQCTLLGIARSGVYRRPCPANDNEPGLMRRIDELFTAWPFLGPRRMAVLLRSEGHEINRKRVQRLMRRMGIAALGPWFDFAHHEGRGRASQRRGTRSFRTCCAG
jgi:putative transposase